MELTAALRSELTITRDPDRPDMPFFIEDRALGRTIRLDEVGARVAQHLDKEQTLAQLAKRLHTTQENLHGAIAFFDKAHLLDTETTRHMVADAKATEAMSLADPATVPLLIQEDARFSCTMCGGCCGGTNIGPVSEAVLQGLKPHMEALEKKTRATSGLFFTLPKDGGGASHTLCRQTRGSCVFLNDDDLCTIHDEHGAEAKPDDCRLFPWMFVATPKGIAVSLQMECRGFNEARKGQRLIDQIPDIRKTLALAKGATRRPQVIPPILTVTGSLTLSFDAYDSLETRLHQLVDTHGRHPTQALIAMRDDVFQASGLEHDTHPPTPDELQRLLHDFLADFHRQLGDIRDAMDHSTPQLEIHTETLELVKQAVATFQHDLVRVFDAPDSRAKRELFQEKAHHFLQQKELLTFDSILQGLTALTLQWLLSQSLAISRAREVKRRHVTEQDLLDALTLTSMVWRTKEFQHILHTLDEPLMALFLDGLHHLHTHREELQIPDHQGHLFKF